jgi:hypothetical protein
MGTIPPKEETLISRHTLSDRWDCSIETIKRYDRRGITIPVRIAPRMVRYRLSDILKIEEAS